MKSKKIIGIVLCMQILLMSIPIATAGGIQEKNSGNEIIENEETISSGFIVGVMHTYYVLVDWCVNQCFKPVCIFRFGPSQERHFFGPLSGTVDLSSFKGFIDPRFYLHVYKDDIQQEFNFFICGFIT
jgi:hypothetical protein